MKQLPIWLRGHDTKCDHRLRFLAVFCQGSGQQSVTNADTATLVLVAYVVVVLLMSEYVFTESGSSTCRRLIAIARTIIGSDVLRDERFLTLAHCRCQGLHRICRFETIDAIVQI